MARWSQRTMQKLTITVVFAVRAFSVVGGGGSVAVSILIYTENINMKQLVLLWQEYPGANWRHRSDMWPLNYTKRC